MKSNKRKQLKINIFAGAGAGKYTLASLIFGFLSVYGYRAYLVGEAIKTKAVR